MKKKDRILDNILTDYSKNIITNYDICLKQLKNLTTKDKKRKVCIDCHNLNHSNNSSILCVYNKENKENKENKDKKENKLLYDKVIEEIKKISKDRKRQVCKYCYKMDHIDNKSNRCDNNIYKMRIMDEYYKNKEKIMEEIKRMKIKKYEVCMICYNFHKENECKVIKDRNERIKRKIIKILYEKGIKEEINIKQIAKEYETYEKEVKKIYEEIEEDIILDIIEKTNIDDIVKNELLQTSYRCEECNNIKYNMNISGSKWRNKIICDKCYIKYDDEINIIKEQINEYIKEKKCEICGIKQEHKRERYQFDHKNMFDKNNSVCVMIKEGYGIEEIKKEIDKCQLVCISCHSVITSMESKLKFIKLKMNLTRKINNENIENVENMENIENIEKKKKYYELYNKKINEVYKLLKENIIKTSKKIE